jgi:hypothetical protein
MVGILAGLPRGVPDRYSRAMKQLALAMLVVVPAFALSAQVGGRVAPDGVTEIQIDLPSGFHRANVSSRGQGCCVQTSLGHSARWQDVPALIDFQKWVQEKGIAGGANPSLVDQRIPRCCKDRGYPVVGYVQYQGRDPEFLKRCLKAGRCPAVTYSRSPTGRYGGSRIAHMTTCVHADEKWVGILDNNPTRTRDGTSVVPGDGKIEWMTWDEFNRICNPGGYWAVALIPPGPPPLPWN